MREGFGLEDDPGCDESVRKGGYGRKDSNCWDWEFHLVALDGRQSIQEEW